MLKRWAEKENYIGGSAQTNCRGPARTLGEVGSSQTKQIRDDCGGYVRTDDTNSYSQGSRASPALAVVVNHLVWTPL